MIQVSASYGIFNGIVAFNLLFLAKLFHCSIYGIVAGILIGNAWHYSYEITLFQESFLSNFFNITLLWSPMLWIPLSFLIYIRFVLKIPIFSLKKDDGDEQHFRGNFASDKGAISKYPYLSTNLKRKRSDGRLCHYGPVISAIQRRTLRDNDSISIDICDIIDEHDQCAVEHAVDLEIQNFFNSEAETRVSALAKNSNMEEKITTTTRPIVTIERVLLPTLSFLMIFMTIKSWMLHDHVMMAAQLFTTILFIMGIKSRFRDEWDTNEVSSNSPCSHTFSILRCAYLSSCSCVLFDAMTYGSWIHYFHFNPPITYLWMLGTRMLLYSVTMTITASILNKRCLADDDPCLLLLPGTTISIFDLARTLGNQVLISHSFDFLFACCPSGICCGFNKKNNELSSHQGK
jgi:hypothetical protein